MTLVLRRSFQNPGTGERLQFDKGVPGAPGFEDLDHCHRPNPKATGDHDDRLDMWGNPVPRGSRRSCILPGGAEVEADAAPHPFTFHDTRLKAIHQDAGHIRLTIGCHDDQDRPAITHVVIEGVERIRLDAMTVDAVEMHARDGEIYHLSHHGNLVTLAVYWYRSPTAHPSCTLYELQGPSMALSIDPAAQSGPPR